MRKNLLDGVYGSLIGSAIGDALGAPVEMLYWTEILEKFGKVTDLMPGKGNTGPVYGGSTGYLYGEEFDGPDPKVGWFSDDTTMRHYMCLSIIENGGRIMPSEYGATLCRLMNPRRVWIGDRITRHRLLLGMNPWDSGRGAIPAGIATMAISPIGLINPGDPRQAYQDAFNIAFVSQEGHNRDGAATFAAGVAAAMSSDATYQSALDTMLAYSSELMRRAISMSLELAAKSGDVHEFAEAYYGKMLDWSWPNPFGTQFDPNNYMSGNTIELVPITMAIIQLCEGDLEKSMIECASFGRDCDTTASMAGALLGAIEGARPLRKDWIEAIESANVDFFEEVEGDNTRNIRSVAERFAGAIRRDRDAKAQRLKDLNALLD